MESRGFTLLETVIFIILAALVIPIFYLTTQPVIKEMMTPNSYIKARFVAQRKMEELMAYTYTDPALYPGTSGAFANVTIDAVFQPPTVPATEYAGYQWQWAVNYLDCNDTVKHCVGYVGNGLVTVPNPPTYTTNYKQIEVTVKGPQGQTYKTTSVMTARY